MKKETATNFFSILFRGQHHIGAEIKPHGNGWCVNTYQTIFATFDYSGLTRMVLMAHKYAVRVEIKPSGPGMLKICIWQRQRDGDLCKRHPTIEQAIQDIVLPENLEPNENHNN